MCKIQRAWKSSLAAECRAALTATDQAFWTQALLREIVTGAYSVRHISHPSVFPLPNPPGSPPTNEIVKWQRRAINSERRIFSSYRKSRRARIPYSLLIFAAAEWNKRHQSSDSQAHALLPRPIVLPGCCSLFISISHVANGCVEIYIF